MVVCGLSLICDRLMRFWLELWDVGSCLLLCVFMVFGGVWCFGVLFVVGFGFFVGFLGGGLVFGLGGVDLMKESYYYYFFF